MKRRSFFGALFGGAVAAVTAEKAEAKTTTGSIRLSNTKPIPGLLNAADSCDVQILSDAGHTIIIGAAPRIEFRSDPDTGAYRVDDWGLQLKLDAAREYDWVLPEDVGAFQRLGWRIE